MIEILNWAGDHFWLIFFVALVFGGSIAEFFGEFFSLIFTARGKIGKLKNENKSLKDQLARRDEEVERSNKLLEKVSGGKLRVGDVDASHTAARMARLLDKVQEADTVVPQLSDSLRSQIDAELSSYHTPPAIEAPKKGKKP
jgi:hypothetical protein